MHDAPDCLKWFLDGFWAHAGINTRIQVRWWMGHIEAVVLIFGERCSRMIKVTDAPGGTLLSEEAMRDQARMYVEELRRKWRPMFEQHAKACGKEGICSPAEGFGSDLQPEHFKRNRA